MSSQEPNTGISRRDMMVKTVGLVGGTAAVGAGAERMDISPVGRARAIAPLIAGAAVAVAGGAAVGYLAKDEVDAILGDDRDYSGYTGADALHTEVYAGGVELESVDVRVFTSIGNNLRNSQNIGLAKGKAAAIEAMNNGASESDATTQMQTAIDEYYSTIQKNLLTHWNSTVNQVQHMFDQVETHSNLSTENVFERGNGLLSMSTNNTNISLLDGTTTDYIWSSGADASGPRDADPLNKGASDNNHPNLVKILDPASSDFAGLSTSARLADGSTTPIDPANAYTDKSLYNKVLWHRDEVNAALSGFVSDVYSAYEPGEIPTEDLIDPITAATELQQNYDGYQTQGAQAAMLGIPTSAQHAVDIIVNPDTDQEENMTVDFYTDYTPSNGFQSGSTYEPSSWSEPLYIAYSYTEEVDGTVEESTDFIQLEEPFFIESIVESDGSTVNSFSPESTNTQTADVAALEEELAQVREERNRLQEEAQSTGGAGGGLLGGLGRNEKIGLGVAGALGLFGLSQRN